MFSSNIVLSQCSSQDFISQTIYLDSTVTSSLIIENAVVDDLSDLLQGVCEVRLNFTHDNVRELTINIVSPNGHSVELIGPFNPTTEQTFNSEWSISFVKCSQNPEPDPTFNGQYTNEDGWFSFGLGNVYNGSYHPYSGCLEDFDFGPVNGLWSLEILSISDFYPGDILSFEIVFCDDNFTCKQCIADPGTFEDIAIPEEYCVGDPALNLDLTNVDPDLADYTHGFFIIQDDSIIWKDSIIDLRSYSPGEYQICGFSHYSETPLAPYFRTYSQLNELLNSASSPICAKLTQDCFTVNIFPYRDTMTIDTTICTGDVFNYNREEYNTAGQYRNSTSSGLCDTLILINLKTVELKALISNDSDLLTCDNDKIPLSIGTSDLTSNTDITWKTANGSLEGSTDGQMITATQKGTYWLVLEEGACSDSFAVEIDVDTDLPILNIAMPDTIDCNTPSVSLLVNSIPSAISYLWTGPNGFVSADQNIPINTPGLYSVDVTLANRCSSAISQEVFSNFEDPVLDLAFSNISCDKSFGEVEILNLSSSYEYTFPGGTLNNETGIIEYLIEGDYTITATSLSNGCSKAVEFTISSDSRLPILSFDPVGSIDCGNLSVELTINADIVIASYEWIGPNGPLVDDGHKITVNQAGVYKAIVTAENGCVDSLEQEVIAIDINLPSIKLVANTITCTSPVVQVDVEVDRDGLSYHWYNDSGFSSSDEDPMIAIPGKYYLEASVSSSCKILDSIIVVADLKKPNLNTDATLITCKEPGSQLTIVNQESGVNYEWTDPLGISIVDVEPIVFEPGMYTLQGIGANGCISNRIQAVKIDTILPTAMAAAPTFLMCATKQVNLSGEGSSIGANFAYSWSTSNGSIIAQAKTLNVLVGSSGTYKLIVTNTDNGCSAQAITELQKATTDLSDFMVEKFDPPCSGTSTGSISVGLVEGGVGPYTFSIDGFNYQSSPVFDMLPAGNYKLSVKDNFGCAFLKNVVLQGGLNISVDLEDNYSINLGDELEVVSDIYTNGDPIWSIQWNLDNNEIASGSERIVVRPLTNSLIEVLISTESGCQDVATALIEVTKDKDVYVPNAFDPSSFGDNSEFAVFATNAIQEISSINVYDRWGNKVFNTGPYDPKTETKTWDGTHRSQNLIPGVYVYLIEVLLIDGEQRKISGEILLMR